MLVCTSYSQSYLQDNIAKPESPAFRDDIFLHIQSHMTALGYTETGFAYSVMRNAHRGIYGKNGMNDTTRQRLLAIGLSADDIETLSDIRYLFIKFRSVLDVRNALILMWYKLHYPETFAELLLK
ncbi:MAG: hypothetical protein ACI4V1_08645 [Eubacteriales bacterium]